MVVWRHQVTSAGPPSSTSFLPFLAHPTFTASPSFASTSCHSSTPEGKATSSLNGMKHGLTGLMHLLPNEDQAEYARHCEGIVNSLHAGSEVELHVAQTLADDYWRIQRVRCLVQKLFNDASKPALSPTSRNSTSTPSTNPASTATSRTATPNSAASRTTAPTGTSQPSSSKPPKPRAGSGSSANPPVNGFGCSTPASPAGHPTMQEKIDAIRKARFPQLAPAAA